MGCLARGAFARTLGVPMETNAKSATHGAPLEFVLIAGRTATQGCGISEGKWGQAYRAETARVQMAPEDLARLGLRPGDRVRLTSAAGQAEAVVAAARPGELPPGVLFIAYGDVSSRLMGADTHGSGMPDSKALDVAVEKVE